MYQGLTNPFFLAWDKDHASIYCVQRDPSNSLVKIRLGSSVTSDLVASGLAWRPSGVAPNSDNKKIYICADQRLQIISFDGIPSITPGPPTLEIHKIQFNYDDSSAIAIKDHVSDNFIHNQPEWIKNTRNEPAAYVRGTHPQIKVIFRKLSGFISGTYAIGATGNLGGIKRDNVTPIARAIANRVILLKDCDHLNF